MAAPGAATSLAGVAPATLAPHELQKAAELSFGAPHAGQKRLPADATDACDAGGGGGVPVEVPLEGARAAGVVGGGAGGVLGT